MQKVCNICQIAKELTEFYKKCSEIDGRQRKCKLCCKEYDKAYYRNNPLRRNKAKAKNTRSRLRNRKFIWQYLAEHPCVDCGENDPIVLEFDHVTGEKRDSIANMLRGLSIKVILAEIAKCEVRCANCHRRKTAVQFGYYDFREVA